ncbi:hypothetical protein HBDW_04040 [Herbaspirillum sp. DW155]|uniref:calcium-binding protein n=1 Tax=Herbaspirillum sp. DW155 TaxID=3095609 RepID=UPI00308F50A4|nr:hypothetical protein HBDW_04040 [Herbaspirillum sp. DW155]
MTTPADQAVRYSQAELSGLKAIYFDTADTLSEYAARVFNWTSVESSLLADRGINANQGGGALIPEGSLLDFVGHSLGGHLAILASRFFPQLADQVVTLNGPGFLPVAESVLSRFSPNWKDEKILRMEGTGDGVSEIGTVYPGKRVLLGQESERSVFSPFSVNHDKVNSVDGLALTELIGKLDPRYAADARLAKSLIDSVSNISAHSYEELLDDFRRLFFPEGIAPTSLNKESDPVSRDSFYVNISALAEKAAFKSAEGRLTIDYLGGRNAENLVQHALMDVAYRYALVTGNPFVVTGADYSAVNTNGKLDLFDKTSGTGKLTQQYLSDRANFLVWKISKNNADADYAKVISSDTTEGDWDYTDMAAKIAMKVDGRGDLFSTAHQIIFGTDTSDTLTGKDQRDHLYGGDGDDTLIGGDGADYLEGGNGADIYQAADGDILFDADSQGVVILAGKRLTGATQRLSEHRWQGAAGEIYTRNGDDLDITLDAQRITIKDGYLRRLAAPSGVLGLALTGEVATPPGDGRVYTGSNLRDIWEWQRIYGVGYYETTGRETFRMGAGDDQVASVGGGDIFYGEDGNDVFIATDGDNYGEGGNGNDVLADGVMLDYISRPVWQEGDQYYVPFLGWTQGPGYWRDEPDVPDVERQERTLGTTGIVMHTLTGTIDRINTNTKDSYAGGQGDDWLWGEGGDDVLAGDAGNDVVYGGEGRDEVTGGDGDDILSGDDLTLNTAGARHGDDFVDGGAGNDTLFGNGGQDDLWGGDGDDRIWGDDAFTPLKFHGDDWISGGAGNDRIYAGGGDDIAYGDEGHDLVVGGEGDDLLYGGDGNDRLVGDLPSAADRDAGTHLYVSATEWSARFYQTQLANGTLSSYAERYQADEAAPGGNDVLDGGAGDDTLMGGRGNDILQGGTGSDTYLFHLGDGVDFIREAAGNVSDVDILQLGSGLTAAATVVTRQGDDLILNWGGDDAVIVNAFFAADASGRIEQVVFADGTRWTADELAAHAQSEAPDNGGDDHIEASHQYTRSSLTRDSFLSRNASVISTSGKLADLDLMSSSFTLNGASVGGDYAARVLQLDTRVAGQATAWIGFYSGGAHSKAVQVRFADKADGGVTATVLNAKYTPGNVLGTDFDWDTNGKLTNVATSNSGAGYGLASMRLNGVPTFVDGRRFEGGAGNDTVDYRAGYAEGASVGIDASLVRGTVLVGGGTDTLSGIENLGGTDAADRLAGDANDNRLEGYAGNDVLYTGAGRDQVSGGDGDDRIEVAHDYQRSSLTWDSFLTRNASLISTSGKLASLDLVGSRFTLNGASVAGNYAARVLQLDTRVAGQATAWIGFYDGAVYSKAIQVRFTDRAGGGFTASVLNAKYTRGNVLGRLFNWDTQGKLTNVATSTTAGGYGLASMTLYGLPAFGDDKVLAGDAGNDTVDYRANYLAGAGMGMDASLVRGTVILGGGVDTLIGIENLGGTDAADRLVGDANDNRIEGYGGNDILSGGRANDMLIGGSGNDTYLYGAGDGKDILVDRDAASGNIDLLTLTDIDQTQLWFRHVGNDLQIDVLGTTDQIRVKDWYIGGASGADNHIERISTADGMTLYDSDVEKLVQAMAAFAPPSAGQTRWTNGQSSNGQVLLTVTH